ncbi:MAG: hypothetical protein QOF68_3171 [Gaiellales bacterium]|nr:hypothetical protein [Gaiellales bacterium]
MYAAVAVATATTYWRLAPGRTYHFSDTGPSGAGSRLVSYANFPVAIGAIAMVGAAARGPLAIVAIALCAVVAVPGVVSQDDLTAQWWNVPALVGVALAVWLTWWAPRPHRRPPLGRLRIGLIALLLVWAVPWIIAAVGLYAEDVPLMGDLIQSREPTPGQPGLASVHLGLHEGLFGAQLAITALVLSASARRLPVALSLLLALMLCYGVMIWAQDGWNEQVIKRGWTDTGVPSVLTPRLTIAWAAVIVAAAAVHVLWFRREHHA